ncbi:DUF3616 domain-containing protein [Nibribacter ruber]|uniref:DUF3616 domain-containing protein n=1 Tax=Nibribacter ruber TaxID=2698458 RepID=A0A6P1NXC4_9BACT|nr:DUF3616 domain-containing protein [Nibribacter ruber]QHL88327.1 DUF3616 domain-containing protein [Nibribacter ruber]
MKNNSQRIELQFDPEKSVNAEGKHVRDGLSTVLRTGDYLWMSCDERTSLERLKKTGDTTFGQHTHFDLSEYLDLPDGKNSEVDIEGLGESGGYLWIVGSHSLKRKKPRKDDSPSKQIKRLAKVSVDPNRYLIARVPLTKDENGVYSLCKECPDPANPEKMLRAAQLKGDKESNQLMDAIQEDPHIKDFLKIPGKDNGFDIEGLALHEDRLFIGLRGPVVRGWAMVLELQLEETRHQGELQLITFKETDRPYKKHFVHAYGKGIRELRIRNNDLYLLAGPTMDLDGVIAVYRWKDAMHHTKGEEQIVHRSALEHLFDVPYGSGETSGQDKAEGLALFDENHLLVVFDSPSDQRKIGENNVLADVYKVQ